MAGYYRKHVKKAAAISKAENKVFWPTNGTGGLQHHKFLMENSILKILWMLKSPLTSVLNKKRF